MIWNSGCAPVSVAELHVRPTLTNKHKPQFFQNAANLTRFENREFGHDLSGHSDALGANKLGFQLWFSILEDHLNDLL